MSVIDVAGGAQPQANENEAVHVVHNGEIYNYHELRAELEAHGHSFRTKSDQARDKLIFASNIRALLAEGGLTPRANPRALDDLFTFGFVPPPQTMFEGIFNLPAAHRMIFEHGEIKIERYWDISFARADEYTNNWDVAVKRFRELLSDCVAIRRMREVPLGALLKRTKSWTQRDAPMFASG